ncbi:hypothetical protein ACFX2C_009295 [Malus domestica]
MKTSAALPSFNTRPRPSLSAISTAHRSRPSSLIHVYLDSPSGHVIAGFANYDTVQHVQSPNNTIYLGQATSIASLLLAVSIKGERRSLPNATVMIHLPSGKYNESKLAPIDHELQSLMADLQDTKFLAPNSLMGQPPLPVGFLKQALKALKTSPP